MTAENSSIEVAKRDFADARPLDRVRDARLPAANSDGGDDGGCDTGCGDAGCDCCDNIRK